MEHRYDGYLIDFVADSIPEMARKARTSRRPDPPEPSRGSRGGQSFWAGDTETAWYPSKDKRHVYLWALYCGTPRSELHGTDCGSLVRTICGLGAGVVYFHNLDYDASYIVTWLLEHDPGRIAGQLLTDDGKLYRLDLYRDGGGIVSLKDSFRKFMASVEDIGKMIGLRKMKSEAEAAGVYDRICGDDYLPTETEIQYCLRDARISWEMMHILVDGHHDRALTASGDARNLMYAELGAFAERLGYVKDASQYNAWRKIWPVPTIGTEELFEFCFNGGWVMYNPDYRKVWTMAESYDANSHYPGIMTEPMPFGGIDGAGRAVIRPEPKPGEWYLIIFRCTFRPRDPMLGWIKTVRIKYQAGFASDEWHSSSWNPLTCRYEHVTLGMTKEEFEDFRKHYIADVSETLYCCFPRRAPYMKNMIAELGADKLRASAAMREAELDKGGESEEYCLAATAKEVAKRKLNSLYGATGMKMLRGSGRFCLDEAGVLRVGDKDWEYTLPVYMPVACYITARGRLKIQEQWWKHPESMIYTDTDSCKVAAGFQWPQDQLDPLQFGKFKEEYRGALNPRGRMLYVLGLKQYVTKYNAASGIRYEIKMAGVPEDGKAYAEKWLREHSDTLPDELDIPGCKRKRHVPGGILIETVTKHMDFRHPPKRII